MNVFTNLQIKIVFLGIYQEGETYRKRARLFHFFCTKKLIKKKEFQFKWYDIIFGLMLIDEIK